MDDKKIEAFKRHLMKLEWERQFGTREAEQRRNFHAFAASLDPDFKRFMDRVLRPVL
jgi:hypothetical protein